MPSIYDQLWSAAVKVIEIRPNSKSELKQKLKIKFPSESELIDQVLEEMERVHLLNDAYFTEQYVNHLTQKNIGRMKILFETRKKGLKNEDVEQALLDAEWSEAASAQRAVEEKRIHIQALEPRKQKGKLMNFLKNRGFSDRVIYATLKD